MFRTLPCVSRRSNGNLSSWAIVARPFDPKQSQVATEAYRHRFLSTIAKHQRPKKVAIVGSGPSGCYTAKYLRAAWDKSGGVDEESEIAIIERLPTPYGLVRFGVAPDHPEVKNVQNDFNSLFESKKGIQFYGNVEVGRDLTIDELRSRFDAVILATGCESDRKLGLPNEENLTGILSAREFVAWYNGHPDFTHVGNYVREALGAETDDQDIHNASVCIVGQGNVALDCARILAKGGKGLFDTDIASHTLPVLGNGVAQITVVGRRGHIQGAFTIKELRELVQLKEEGFETSFVVREDELDLGSTPASIEELESAGGRPKQRINKLLRKAATENEEIDAPKRIDLRFLMSPSTWEPSQNDPSRLGAVICERTRLVGEPGRQRAIGSGETERIPAQLALVSIGYKAVAISSLDEKYFDEDRGVVKHVNGRIDNPNPSLGGLYAAGWLKRGATGIIGTNIPDARETVATILGDLQRPPAAEGSRGNSSLSSLLEERGVKIVNWEAYQRIVDRESVQRRTESQPREKITDLNELIETALV
eukprot:CAMPEP_0172448278 /NCGR_PEP_ID=MMETSP1065-20121228/7318_1 /TAXON_ID=265537 /ORGANISM="Amphiprora paludosa, Strain CCMP125" /LENGTH=536 /DNA_ID=CAMNT_0013199723 /DNA_START=44 /DNA_END=1654 /DNA_ORIENTATION=+